MRTLTSITCLVLAAGTPPAVATGQQRPPVIDMHMHAHLPDVPAGTPVPCVPQPCSGVGRATATSDETLRRTLEFMDRYNVVLGFLSGDSATLSQWVAAAPRRFVPSAFIWQVGSPPPATLRREYGAGRLAGMGEIATQYFGMTPDDPALEPYFSLAEELDVPVHIHTLGIGAPLPGFRSAAGNPLHLEPVLVRHPRLRLFVENAGYPYLGEMIAMMYQYPQLHADLATITWLIPREAFYDYLRALVRAGLGGRLMFGSDQMRWPEVIPRAIDAIQQADFLTPQQKMDILCNNAARFLRLQSPCG